MIIKDSALPTARGSGGSCGIGPVVGDQVFPLQYLDVPAVFGKSRARVRSRAAAAKIKEANETIFALNFLAGYGLAARDPSADMNSGQSGHVQAAVLSDIHDLVAEDPE